jgi:hypothetical protein
VRVARLQSSPRAAGVDEIDAETGDVLPMRRVPGKYALRAKLQSDGSRPQRERPVENGLRCRQTRKKLDILQARQEVVGERDGGPHDRPCPGQRPELQAQIRVVRDADAMHTRMIDRCEHRVAGRRADGLADAGHVQEPRAGDQSERQVGGGETTGRRTRPPIAENVPRGTVGDEVDGSRRIAVDRHTRGIHPFPVPEIQQLLPELVGPELRDVARPGTLPGRCDHSIHRVATKPVQKASRLSGDLAELDHRFSETQHVQLHGIPLGSERWPGGRVVPRDGLAGHGMALLTSRMANDHFEIDDGFSVAIAGPDKKNRDGEKGRRNRRRMRMRRPNRKHLGDESAARRGGDEVPGVQNRTPMAYGSVTHRARRSSACVC